jgi:hypothetical protein
MRAAASIEPESSYPMEQIMNRVLSFAVAAGLIIAAGSAFAQTMGNPALGTPPHALGSPVPASSQVAAAPAAPMTMKGDNADASRATDALNLLEARGYADFSNFTADGNNFRATVYDNGQPATVSINPFTGDVTGL